MQDTADLPPVPGTALSRRARALNAGLLALLLCAGTAFLWLMSSLPRIDGELVVAGLEHPATVTRDGRGVPRIVGRSVHDAYLALGFVHAQDRFWQMELHRRVGTGRLAELVGERALGNDRFMRTLGLGRLAEASLDAVDEPTREALEAYAEGVNAWIGDHRNRMPLEFLLLGHRPEPWRPADSLVWARLMALQLTGNWRDEALRAALARSLPPQRVRELWPDPPADAPVTLSAAGTGELLALLPEAAVPRVASNVWAVDGRRTASGKPLLANDPHLGFQMPILWYLAGLEAPGLSLAGATVPGVPFHLIGHNGSVAWGTTTTHADTVDLVVEKLAGEDAYATPEGPRPFSTRIETIRVKDAADVELVVRETVDGPVISDLVAKDLAGPGEVVAFKSTALVPDDRTAQAFHRLNRARNWQEFDAALSSLHAPVQNFAYADTAGTIGFLTAGRVPVRRSGDGSAPARGWTGEAEWKGWVPHEGMPRTVAPRSGLVINANNKVAGADYPYLISAQWPETYRARRAADILDGASGLTAGDLLTLQTDSVSLAARELKGLLAGLEGGSKAAREALAALAAWDGTSGKERFEPLVFWTWMEELNRSIFADELGASFKAFGTLRPYALAGALTANRHWCDDTGTIPAESCEQVALAALERTLADLANRHGPAMGAWKWGDDHVARFDHAVLGKLPLVGMLFNAAAPSDGDDFTINRGSYAAAPDGPSFRHFAGAGMRVVFDLADLSQSRFVIATGQSGNPLSIHYADMNPAWQANDGIAIGRKRKGEAVLRLMPSDP